MGEGDQKPPGGNESPPLTQEEQQQQLIMQAMMDEISNHLVALASQFAPPTTTPKTLQDLATYLLKEQIMIVNDVLPSVEMERAKERPHIVIEITGPKGAKFQMRTTKRPELCSSLPEALSWAMLTSFLFSPAVRGILRLHGYNYQLQEVKPSSIIMPTN